MTSRFSLSSPRDRFVSSFREIYTFHYRRQPWLINRNQVVLNYESPSHYDATGLPPCHSSWVSELWHQLPLLD